MKDFDTIFKEIYSLEDRSTNPALRADASVFYSGGYQEGYNKALDAAMELVNGTCCDSTELEDLLCGLESSKYR